jgi:hypothetical protein
MKRILNQGLACLPAPWPILARDALRYLRYPRIRREWRQKRRILGKLPGPRRVAQGPFRGMGYIPLAASGQAQVLPKLLGTYEKEIYPAVEEICRAGCDRIVVIGAAEGYYAVGLAWRNPGVELTGFESDASQRYYLRRMARCNGVRGRITIAGECTPAVLAAALAGAERAAVFCDCEGAEDVLLDPGRVPDLRRALILVETHEGMVPGVERRLLERFGPSHEIAVIRSRPRTRGDLPDEGDLDLTEEEVAAATDEHRRRAEWMFLRRNAG